MVLNVDSNVIIIKGLEFFRGAVWENCIAFNATDHRQWME